MPHACTNCGRTFPDGSKEMLSGCPDCGGNKFRYHPDGVPDDAGEPTRAPPEPDDRGLPARDRGSVVDRATTTVREWVNQRSDRPDGTPRAAGERPDDRRERGPDPDPDPDLDTDSGSTGDDGGRAAGSTTTDADRGRESSADPATPAEDTAQADARGGVADPDEISDGTPAAGSPGDAPDLGTTDDGAADGSERPTGPGTPTEGRARTGAGADVASGEPAPAEPEATPSASNLAQLREELNEQFESIKIVEPGEYELNLMGLYDREEYIISLMEDGRYAIEVPETWRDSEESPE